MSSIIVRMIEMPMAMLSALAIGEGLYEVYLNKNHSEDYKAAALSEQLEIIRERYQCTDVPEYENDPNIRAE